MSKYVGGAVVVFDLRLRRVKWQQHLDLSTDSTPYRAYIYSAPVLVDLDRDGKLEVVVGTSAVRNPGSAYTVIVHRLAAFSGTVTLICSNAQQRSAPVMIRTCPHQFADHWADTAHRVQTLYPHTSDLHRTTPLLESNPLVAAGQGFLYVLDCKGAPREGWPIQMAEIQAQPAVADINGDGEVEIVVADVHGNVAAFNWRGREIWERHLKSLISQVPLLCPAARVILGTHSLAVLTMLLTQVHFLFQHATTCHAASKPRHVHRRTHVPSRDGRL